MRNRLREEEWPIQGRTASDPHQPVTHASQASGSETLASTQARLRPTSRVRYGEMRVLADLPVPAHTQIGIPGIRDRT